MVCDFYLWILLVYLNKIGLWLLFKFEFDDMDYWEWIIVCINVWWLYVFNMDVYLEVNFEVFLFWFCDSGDFLVFDEYWMV